MAIEVKRQREIRTDLTPDELKLIPAKNPAYKVDKEFLSEVGADIAQRRPVLLTGMQGCGKTTMFMQIAAAMNQPTMRANMNGQTTISELVGYNTVKDGNVVWVDGVLTMCIRRGFFLILDEIDFAPPEVLAVINSVAEKGGYLMLKEKGTEVVVPHKDFVLLATANTVGCMEEYRHLFVGANQMNQALIDRFRVYHVTWMPPADEAQILVDTVQGCPLKAAQVLVRLANSIREAFVEEQIDKTFSLRALIDLTDKLMWLRKVEAAKDEKDRRKPNETIAKAVERCIYSKVSRKDAEKIRQMVDKISIVEK